MKRGSELASLAVKKSKIPSHLHKKCIETVRVLCADVVEKANSGHPGAPMGCAPMAHLLWSEIMNYNPNNSKWSNRDRFVLSNGHACALLYSMLHLTGYPLSMDDLKQFRQVDSLTPGHPENFATVGVEVSTGPLGQGISNAVGLAIAESHLAAEFNKEGFPLVNHFTYVICGDGCLQEGISSEACSLAGHLGLGKLIVLYDDNLITIDGHTDLSFTENVSLRFDSYNWQTITVPDVTDVDSLRQAIHQAQEETTRPTLIKIRTIIGHGSLKEGTHGVHGAPLGKDDIAHLKTTLGMDPSQSFVVDGEVRELYNSFSAIGASKESSWESMFAAYAQQYPAAAAEYRRRMAGELPADWLTKLPNYSAPESKATATRQQSEQVLNSIAIALPELMGGSADLTPSNLTHLKCSGDYQKDTPIGRYLRFGVREHAMVAICNGISAHDGLRPFCATFLNFMGYAMGAVRLSALSRFGVLFIMTHDSIGLGEDGPTHQPIEMLEQLRSMPNLLVFRPCDPNETLGSYVQAIEHKHTPSVLSLSRQAAPALPNTSPQKVALGAYVLTQFGSGTPALILTSSGTEVQLAVQTAAAMNSADGVCVRVVSFPCWELFEDQPLGYQMEVFPDGIPVMSIEASGSHGWQKYSHAPYGMTSYGASGPGGKIYEKFGFTVPNLSARAREVISFYQGTPARSLVNYPNFKTGGH